MNDNTETPMVVAATVAPFDGGRETTQEETKVVVAEDAADHIIPFTA